MTKGLPGSGKSTWALARVRADEGGTKRVNKDDLRRMLDAGEWSKANEKFILVARDVLVANILGHGHNVIVDDTNLAPKHEATLRQLARNVSNSTGKPVGFEIKDFTDVPVDVCIKRDLERLHSVGEKVIRDMWRKYLFEPEKPKPAPSFINGAPLAIIVDIDGTVAQMVNRGPHDYDRVSEDKPKVDVIRLVREWVQGWMDNHAKWHLIFCSGRPDSCREDTEAWLKDNVLFGLGLLSHEWSLFMRPTWMEREDGKTVKDHRKDSIVKQEIYEREILGNYNVEFVLDDRQQVVDMWRDQGLLCLQVAPGNF